MERIAVLTSGGDAPGMNACIRAVVRTAIGRGAKVFGVWHGFDGLIDGDIKELNTMDVGGIISRGGTILRSGRSERFLTEEGRAQAAEQLRIHEIKKLIVIGGDGSLTGALKLSREQDVHVIGAPGSIDNDISGTDVSIGFDTAVNTAVEAIDKIRDTAYSHDRVFVIEVMGRRNGYIAVEAGLAGGAEAILIPEIPFSLRDVCDKLESAHIRGKRSSIIVVAEGAVSAYNVQKYIQDETGFEVRPVVLGHVQRGGSPTSFDRVVATHIGAEAVNRIAKEARDEMIGWTNNKVSHISIEEALSTERKVDPARLLLADVMAQ